MRGFAVGVSSMLWLLLLVSEMLLLPQLAAGGAPSLPGSDGRSGLGLAGWSSRSLLQEGDNATDAGAGNSTGANETKSSNSSSPSGEAPSNTTASNTTTNSSISNITLPSELMPSLSDDFMGMWQGVGGDFSYCGVSLGSTLTMAKDARGNILANFSMVSGSAHYSDVALDAVAEIVMMNITEELVVRGKTASGGEVAAYSIELQLLDVMHWHHGCDGKPYDRTVDWTEAAAACRAASMDSSPNCTVAGTLNVSSSATLPGEWEIDLCFHSFWDLPSAKGTSNTNVGQKEGFCLTLVQHKAAMPGVYRFDDCSCQDANDCPPAESQVEVMSVDPAGCFAKIGSMSGFGTVGNSVLDCPNAKDTIKVGTEVMGTVWMIATWKDGLWKSPSKMCYGKFTCVGGQCQAMQQVANKSRQQGTSCAQGESNIFFVTPNTVDPAGGTRITVAGQCLGASAKVSAGGIECSTTTLSTRGDLECSMPAGFGYGLGLSILQSGVSTFESCGQGGGCNVTFRTPAITSVTPSSCPDFAGCTMTVTGSGFGDPADTARRVQVVVAGQECDMSPGACDGCGHLSNIEVRCRVPASTPSVRKPVVLNRFATLRSSTEESGCPRCGMGYIARDLGSGCSCVATGSGGMFEYLGSSPRIAMTLQGEVLVFDRAEFVRKVSSLVSIHASQVYIVSVQAGSVVVTFAFTNSVSNAGHMHIQALGELKASAANGNLTRVMPEAAGMRILGEDGAEGEEVALVVTKFAAPAGGEGGLQITVWQAVIIAMVFVGGVVCGMLAWWGGAKKGAWGQGRDDDDGNHHGHDALEESQDGTISRTGSGDQSPHRLMATPRTPKGQGSNHYKV